MQAVRSNKFRSLMTIIGVMIGVGAVILVNTIMDGFTAYANSSIDKIGSNVIYVTKWDEDTDFDNLTEEERRRKDITMNEAAAVMQMCPAVKAVSPEKVAYYTTAKYGNKSINTYNGLRGCWPTQPVVTNRYVTEGRFINETDVDRKGMVCVIGPDIADALFPSRDEAIDKKIRVSGYEFRVIGVQEHIDDLFDISQNNWIFIPMSTFERLFPNIDRVYLLASAVSAERFDEALDQVTNALRRVRKVRPEEPNNFGFETQERFRKMITDITIKVQLGATAVAFVGLMVGVIGVMNIMLIAVTQRTREIGVRKAVGAKRANILFQFLVEAATLTGLGGLVGIIVGGLVGFVVTALLDWHYSLSPLWVMIALSMSVGSGMIAGMYPAWRAARVDPIVALRYE